MARRQKMKSWVQILVAEHYFALKIHVVVNGISCSRFCTLFKRVLVVLGAHVADDPKAKKVFKFFAQSVLLKVALPQAAQLSILFFLENQ